jgi:hypothetical protein
MKMLVPLLRLLQKMSKSNSYYIYKIIGRPSPIRVREVRIYNWSGHFCRDLWTCLCHVQRGRTGNHSPILTFLDIIGSG